MKPTQKIGPKHQLVNPMPRNLMLTEEVIDKARRIGKGNLSAGVRKAVMEHTHQMAWQKIETAPKDGTKVIICVTGTDGKDLVGEGHYVSQGPLVGWHWGDDGFCDECCGSMHPYAPTHWASMPEPPHDATTARTSDDQT